MPDGSRDTPTFQPLGNYQWPNMPTEDTVRTLASRLRRLFHRMDSAPFITDDSLQQETRGLLGGATSAPVCGPLMAEMDQTFTAWADDPARSPRVRLVILPPCDANQLLLTWAKQHGHDVLEPPARGTMMGERTPEPADPPDLRGEGLLVIPRLEHWFLRHRHGLTAIEALLDQLDGLERKCLVGCNSWAWMFLKKAVQANMILPEGVTFHAFDGPRLRDWFAELDRQRGRDVVAYRLSKTGHTLVLKPEAEADREDPSDDETYTHDYFKRLAAHSLGVPWVAWHLWRDSLRSRAEDAKNDHKNKDHDDGEDPSTIDPDNPAASDSPGQQQTLWIAALQDFTLPGQDEPDELLVLQALLIHGALTPDELRAVLPTMPDGRIVRVLSGAGLIQRDDENRLRCVPSAYPSIRRGLTVAGFPKDEL